MKKLIAILALALAACASVPTLTVFAARDHGEYGIVLYNEPGEKCQAPAKKLTLRIKGDKYDGCYVVHEGVVYAKYEDGDRGVFPLAQVTQGTSNKSL